MYAYLENYLGESVRADWKRYKVNFSNEYKELSELGNNPHNFAKKIHLLVTGEDPNSGLISHQQDAMKKLEQIYIRDWRYIKAYINDFVKLGNISGSAMDYELGQKMMIKLLGALGSEILVKWNKTMIQVKDTSMQSHSIRGNFILKHLVEKLMYLYPNLKIIKR
ncbi:hypothetical protein PanWU01x14_056400 [Parasponia andersonii]|uniref:Uncharacterized protein n=1 Tax=Parasponia andersonii TaxID=3476 RepID=A0A2P5DKC5_PARAD|nr:hypothetical protein PanWU01x14_056400 [Parasponia andersonii]